MRIMIIETVNDCHVKLTLLEIRSLPLQITMYMPHQGKYVHAKCGVKNAWRNAVK